MNGQSLISCGLISCDVLQTHLMNYGTYEYNFTTHDYTIRAVLGRLSFVDLVKVFAWWVNRAYGVKWLVSCIERRNVTQHRS